MSRRALACWLLAASAFAVAAADAPPHVGRHVTTDADLRAIQAVADEFRAALAAKDARRLSGLLLNGQILFTSPASPARVRRARDERNVHADGVPSGGVAEFLNFVASANEPIEERFHNLRIIQDGHLAWVMFDYEFLEGGRIENHGVEVWQLLKTADERWKILSVVWSSHGMPK